VKGVFAAGPLKKIRVRIRADSDDCFHVGCGEETYVGCRVEIYGPSSLVREPASAWLQTTAEVHVL
jgi:hypothetical protein